MDHLLISLELLLPIKLLLQKALLELHQVAVRFGETVGAGRLLASLAIILVLGREGGAAGSCHVCQDGYSGGRGVHRHAASCAAKLLLFEVCLGVSTDRSLLKLRRHRGW